MQLSTHSDIEVQLKKTGFSRKKERKKEKKERKKEKKRKKRKNIKQLNHKSDTDIIQDRLGQVRLGQARLGWISFG